MPNRFWGKALWSAFCPLFVLGFTLFVMVISILGAPAAGWSAWYAELHDAD